MYGIEQNPEAKADLAEILKYFSQFYARTPEKFLAEYYKKLESLTFFPEMHRRWPRRPYYRVFYVRYFAVFYTVDPQQLYPLLFPISVVVYIIETWIFLFFLFFY